jgi:hypothetical protein
VWIIKVLKSGQRLYREVSDYCMLQLEDIVHWVFKAILLVASGAVVKQMLSEYLFK